MTAISAGTQGRRELGDNMQLLEEYTTGYGTALITLRAYIITPSADQPDLMASSLRIDVISAEGFPADIFVWERQETMLDNGSMWSVVRPVCVAKPSDLSVYPVKSPKSPPDSNPPYFRDSFLSFQIESPDLLLDTWINVKLDVGNLIRTTMMLGGPP